MGLGLGGVKVVRGWEGWGCGVVWGLGIALGVVKGALGWGGGEGWMGWVGSGEEG